MPSSQHSSTYGQYCPLALAAELLCRRWTILIVSRLLDGCRTFNEIHQGVPRISPSLLSNRLTELEQAGILTRRKLEDSKRYVYEPTAACLELNDVVDGMAVWGQRWARDNEIDDLDPAFLAWSISTRMNIDELPDGRTVIEFEFSGTPTEFRRFWLVSHDAKIDMCLKDPGFETDLLVRADIRHFVEAWRGFRDLRGEIRAGRIKLLGPRPMAKAFPDWLLLSGLAPHERQAEGRENRLSRRHRA